MVGILSLAGLTTSMDSLFEMSSGGASIAAPPL